VREENDLGGLEADASCLRCSVVIEVETREGVVEVGGVSRSWQTAKRIRQSESLFCEMFLEGARPALRPRLVFWYIYIVTT
jgi:hypothetical protein